MSYTVLPWKTIWMDIIYIHIMKHFIVLAKIIQNPTMYGFIAHW